MFDFSDDISIRSI